MNKNYYLLPLLVLLCVSMVMAGYCDINRPTKPEVEIKITAVVSEHEGTYLLDKAYEGELVDIKTTIKNLGTENIVGKRVECGIYQRDDVSTWYGGLCGLLSFWGASDNVALNCLPNQGFVATKKVSLIPGELNSAVFRVTGPDNLGGSYVVHCTDFWNCYDQDSDTGQTGYSWKAFTLLGTVSEPSCEDSAMNGDETDWNCGGSACEACDDNYRCKLDRDCESNNCCDGFCSSEECEEDDDDDGGDGLSKQTIILIAVGALAFIILIMIMVVALKK